LVEISYFICNGHDSNQNSPIINVKEVKPIFTKIKIKINISWAKPK
jgi:hypothetical protein